MCNEIFDLYFFHDSNPSGSLINRVKYYRIRFQFRRDIRSQSSKKVFSFMIDVFTPKRISPDCTFKSNQRLSKISILTQRYAAWLLGVMRTAELDSKVWCIPQILTPWCAHYGVFWEIWVAWLCGGMHITEYYSAGECTPRSFFIYFFSWLRNVMHNAELDSVVGCTPQSLT